MFFAVFVEIQPFGCSYGLDFTTEGALNDTQGAAGMKKKYP
jgi:hypothetical protein